MLAIFVVLLGALLFIKPVYAGESPIQTSPSNGSIVSSSALNWQAPTHSLYATNPYRVQVDDNSSFPSSSINKDYYTKNTYYSPVLGEGTWYWRVKAKDSSGIWSGWSSVWSFTLQSTPSSPSPTPTPTPIPSPTPSSTSSSSTSSSSFTISNVPSQINSDEVFAVSVNLSSPKNPDTTYYLAGAFKIVEGSRYFGLTKKDSSWVQYNSASFSNQFKITTNSSGTWTGDLEVKPDLEDSDYKGSGDYTFKVARYTQTGSQTWSNELTIKIISTETSEQGGTSTDTSSTSNPSTSPSVSPSVKKTVTSSKSKSYASLVYHTATVAAATESAIPSPTAEVKGQKQKSYFSWAGVLMIISGTLVLAFVYLRSRNLTDAILNFFRKRN